MRLLWIPEVSIQLRTGHRNFEIWRGSGDPRQSYKVMTVKCEPSHDITITPYHYDTVPFEDAFQYSTTHVEGRKSIFTTEKNLTHKASFS